MKEKITACGSMTKRRTSEHVHWVHTMSTTIEPLTQSIFSSDPTKNPKIHL